MGINFKQYQRKDLEVIISDPRFIGGKIGPMKKAAMYSLVGLVPGALIALVSGYSYLGLMALAYVFTLCGLRSYTSYNKRQLMKEHIEDHFMERVQYAYKRHHASIKGAKWFDTFFHKFDVNGKIKPGQAYVIALVTYQAMLEETNAKRTKLNEKHSKRIENSNTRNQKNRPVAKAA